MNSDARSTRLPLGAAPWIGIVLLPVTAAGGLLVAIDGLPWITRLGVFSLGMSLTLALAWVAGRRILGTFATVSDLLAALREGDYGLRGRVRPGHDPLQGLLADVNLLSDALREGRRKRTEASRFLAKTLTALKDPVFVGDEEGKLRLINPAARQLIGAERATVVGRDLVSLGLSEALATPDHAVFHGRFPGGEGRWAVRRATWHSEGREHRLIMLRDLSAALGQEERRAWQRLIRVLSHELNNSLTPIASLAGSLATMLERQHAEDLRSDLQTGLETIGRRADSLARFLSGYGKLARLPPPRPHLFRLDVALARLASLDRRLPIDVASRESVTLYGDEDQLSQAFINLMRNAVEAALPVAGGVRLDWYTEGRRVCILIEDDGVGLPDSDALFVPFFTTKPEGSGIGLSLTRLIVEAHAGSVELVSRGDTRGAVATVRLPLLP
ncbi:sensor histidine kinase [Luteibacter yeojuensis]|uniref:histidine kinase n=1 Tax=Luteibacter yeojuensis TaxID=345309 RepID=A0A7X5QW74_9GAMM|nr:ATP-binding protein [Luteibacter yeojuensis]NID16452.1 histidine kinase [Luteibacter yeojuensis]